MCQDQSFGTHHVEIMTPYFAEYQDLMRRNTH